MNLHFVEPVNWNDFEDLVCDIAREEYRNPNFQRYGRQGQRQHGIDIFGLTDNGVIGIQCKRLEEKLTTKLVREIIEEAREFKPPLAILVIATTAKRDTETVDELTKPNGEPNKPFETVIWYWEEIVNLIKKHPRIIDWHFGSEYKDEIKIINNSIYSIPQRTPIMWPCSQEELMTHCLSSMGNPPKNGTPYKLTIGISSFKLIKNSIPRDIEVDLVDVTNEKEPTQTFFEIGRIFDQLCSVIKSDFFDTQVIFEFNLHLSHAFLLGYKFRKIKNWNPVFVQGSMIWPSQGMEMTLPGLRIHTPHYTGTDSTEIAIILGVREITRKVIDSISNWKHKPRVIYPFSRNDHILDSAVPMSLSYDFAKTISTLTDEGDVSRIHLFLAVPKSLAALIAVNLGRTCPISLYHLDKEGKTYQLSGTIEME